MRTPEEFPLDPEIAGQLDAIDATLAGEPVDPQYAEVAELALLITVDRPSLRPKSAAELDELVARRFRSAPGESVPGARTGSSRLRRWPGMWSAAGGLATGLAALIAVVIAVGGGSSTPSPLRSPESASSTTQGSAASSASGATSTSSSAAPGTAGGGSSAAQGAGRLDSLAANGAPQATTPGPGAKVISPPAANPANQALVPAPSSFGAAAGARSLSLPSNGRKTIQSAQLALVTAPTRIDTVAQEAFNAIGAESGIVRHSNVTATNGSDGYAELQLSVPSGNLAALMNRLSQLRYAHVASRTDASQDVNDRYVVDVRRLADARALRTSLLKQLAAATTQEQIDSLKTQIRDAEASIASDEATLASLNKQVNLSQVDLTISAGAVPVTPPASGSGGFTLGRAAHDAGRVLTVAAGVALIALAALVPVGLVVALVAWIALVLRRRGREQALDAAA